MPAPSARSKSAISKTAGARRRAGSAPARDAYHHGALREALIEATEALLAERGPEGFSLREVARRSGVSPAAPAHHFGDARGLLAAVATLAFDGLTEALRAGDERGGSDPLARLREQGLGYVGFALRHPGRFGIMFRADIGGAARSESIEHSARAAYLVLEEGVRLLLGVPAGSPLTPSQGQALLATWSVVHGFAHLALAGQFDQIAAPAASAADCDGPPAPLPSGRRGREILLREVLSPLLEQHLRGLVLACGTAPTAAAAAVAAAAATSGSR